MQNAVTDGVRRSPRQRFSSTLKLSGSINREAIDLSA
jgi:hypothetical protein